MESSSKENSNKFELNKTDIAKLGFDLSSEKPYYCLHSVSTTTSSPPTNRTNNVPTPSSPKFHKASRHLSSSSRKLATDWEKTHSSTFSTTSSMNDCSCRLAEICTFFEIQNEQGTELPQEIQGLGEKKR